MTTRSYRPGWLRTLDKILHPKRTARRAIKRKTKKLSGRRTSRPLRKELGQRPRAGLARHDIVPGRTLVEWLTSPELGRGTVLAILPGQRVDVQFAAGGRPPSGVPIEEIRVLA